VSGKRLWAKGETNQRGLGKSRSKGDSVTSWGRLKKSRLQKGVKRRSTKLPTDQSEKSKARPEKGI